MFKSIRILAVWLGLVATAAAQNFTLTIQPNSVELVPGQASSFVVSSTPVGGFNTNITFSVGTLPSGVTAVFQPNTLKPPGTTLLTLTAATNATVGSFTLNISASGGGITNTTSSSVSVNFGLIPLCYGNFSGQVTDSQTGLPIPYATVYASSGYQYAASADVNGNYIITNVVLGANNEPETYSIYSIRSNYYQSATQSAYAVCDATNVVNTQMILEQFGSLSGTISIQGGGTLPTNCSVAIEGLTSASTNAASGTFAFTHLPLNYTNAPAGYVVYSQPPGFWEAATNTVVFMNSNTVVSLTLIPICYGTVSGQLIYGDTLLPVANTYVSTYGGAGYVTALTDTNGNYTLTNVALGNDNAALNSTVTATANNYYQASTNYTLSSCGQSVVAPTLRLQPRPQDVYATVSGHVYDIQTHLPLTNAFLYCGGPSAVSDSNGYYLITNIYIGTTGVTNENVGVSASDNGYFNSASNLTIYSTQTATQDFNLLKIQYGYINGTVRDSATLALITNAYVSVSTNNITGPSGQYGSSALPLNYSNVPTAEYYTISAPGYYSTSTNTTISAGVTNTVNVNLIKICTAATIVGNVVNAITQAPITNATISAGYNYTVYAYSDTNGNFILTNVTVGNLNSPVQVTVNASAPGYNPQSHAVTIFCDATITTEFGAPQTALAVIEGVVTNAITGEPLANVFIGSGFGESTYTDTNGFYQLTQTPLGPNNSPRTWTVTAIPTNFTALTLSVTAQSNVVSVLNFGFGQAPSELMIGNTGNPPTVRVGSNVVYTVVISNIAANALSVVLTDTLPTNSTFISAVISNQSGAAFTTPVYSNGVVTSTSPNLGSNGMATFLFTVLANASGTLTNQAVVTSATPDVNPGTHGAQATNVANAISMTADLAVTFTTSAITSLTNPIVYTLTVTNGGPSDVPVVTLQDTLPTNVTYVSSTTSQGSGYVSNLNSFWNLGLITNGGHAIVTITVLPENYAALLNTAVVAIGAGSGAITDTNLANNTFSASASVPPVVIASGTFSLAYTTPTNNPQTGLFQQTVTLSNNGTNVATNIVIFLRGLPSYLTLYNATGITNYSGTNVAPFIEYDPPIAPGGSATFALEYYSTSRYPFTFTNFLVTALSAGTQMPSYTGQVLGVSRSIFTNGVFLIEFASTPGATYIIQYRNISSDIWLNAVPPIVAAGTRTQWLDSGPPKTQSSPMSVGSRLYRVLQPGTSTNVYSN